jgi:hypothetical protein
VTFRHIFRIAALAAVGLCLLGAATLEARTTASLGDGSTLRVSSRPLSGPGGGSEGPGGSGIWYQIYKDQTGEVLDEGWVIPTHDTIEDRAPTVAYDPWTETAVVVWSRGVGAETDLFVSTYGEEAWSLPRRFARNSAADLDPVVTVDTFARIHLVWWQPVGDESIILYQNFFPWSYLPYEGDPKIIDLPLDEDHSGRLQFPYIAYQQASDFLYLVVSGDDGAIQLCWFDTQAASSDPLGGGEIVIPVTVEPPSYTGDPLETAPQPMLTFAGAGEIPVVYWVEGNTLYYFYLEDGAPSPVFSKILLASYDPAGLEKLVKDLVKFQVHVLPARPPRGQFELRSRLR